MFVHSVIEASIALAGLTAGVLVLLRVINLSDSVTAFRKAVFVAVVAVFTLHLICCFIRQVVVPSLIGFWNLLKPATVWGALALSALVAITIARSIIAALNRKPKNRHSRMREGGFHEYTNED